jgi:hypothetical protein
MKSQNRISQLTLELYHRGLTTRKENKLVEKALETDSEVRKRYTALQESEREIRQLVTKELARLNIAERPIIPAPHNKKLVAGFLLAAAILLCAIIPAVLYLKNSNSNKNNAIAEETVHEINIPEETGFTEDVEEKAVSPEQPVRRERGSSAERTRIAESPRREGGPAVEQEFKPESGGAEIAAIPDTGIRMRGESQPDNAAVSEQEPNINIPPGISFIFDNMFANRNLTFVIIPARITSIGKNAFSGNPLVSVTIGANVSMDDNAIPGNFASVYNAGGKTAGTYTRPDTDSEAWKKR